MISAVEDAGFGAAYVPPGLDDGAAGVHSAAQAAQQELAYWWGLFSASLWFTVPVFFAAMVLPRIPGELSLLHKRTQECAGLWESQRRAAVERIGGPAFAPGWAPPQGPRPSRKP